jgi:hypothetical protein
VGKLSCDMTDFAEQLKWEASNDSKAIDAVAASHFPSVPVPAVQRGHGKRRVRTISSANDGDCC